MKDVTKRGEVVLDSFLGSGTTLIACDRTGAGVPWDRVRPRLRRCRSEPLSRHDRRRAGHGRNRRDVRLGSTSARLRKERPPWIREDAPATMTSATPSHRRAPSSNLATRPLADRGKRSSSMRPIKSSKMFSLKWSL
ncbi:MAG: hypothetical protein WDN76_08180 [Alphaproteobacteria bacterium]